MNFRRRLLYAGALALLVHICGLPWLPRPQHEREVVYHDTQVRLFVIKATPKPKPHRTPRPKGIHPKIVRRRIHHRAVQIAGARARGIARKHLPPRIAKAPPHIFLHHEIAPRTAPPVATASTLPRIAPIAANGTDGTTAQGPSISGAGAGGTGEAGSGTGTQGTGDGNGGIPCGALDLVSVHTHIVRGRVGENGSADQVIRTEHTIRATIHFADGHTETDIFPYPFVFGPTEQDPYAHENRNNSSMLTLVQFPPASFDRSTLSPVIRSILNRTSVEGISLLLPCDQTVP